MEGRSRPGEEGGAGASGARRGRAARRPPVLPNALRCPRQPPGQGQAEQAAGGEDLPPDWDRKDPIPEASPQAQKPRDPSLDRHWIETGLGWPRGGPWAGGRASRSLRLPPSHVVRRLRPARRTKLGSLCRQPGRLAFEGVPSYSENGCGTPPCQAAGSGSLSAEERRPLSPSRWIRNTKKTVVVDNAKPGRPAPVPRRLSRSLPRGALELPLHAGSQGQNQQRRCRRQSGLSSSSFSWLPGRGGESAPHDVSAPGNRRRGVQRNLPAAEEAQ